MKDTYIRLDFNATKCDGLIFFDFEVISEGVLATNRATGRKFLFVGATLREVEERLKQQMKSNPVYRTFKRAMDLGDSELVEDELWEFEDDVIEEGIKALQQSYALYY